MARTKQSAMEAARAEARAAEGEMAAAAAAAAPDEPSSEAPDEPSAEEPPAACDACEVQLAPNDSVRLHGLSRADLNGKTGVLIKYSAQKGRWGVRLSKSGKEVAVRPQNLEPFDEQETAWSALVEEAAALQIGRDDSLVLDVGGQRFPTSRRVLMACPDSFFEPLLRQHDDGQLASQEDGSVLINRPPELFAHILTFLEGWPCKTELDPSLTPEQIDALAAEADFYLLPALVWLLGAHRVNLRVLKSADRIHRHREDVLRWLFAKQRDAPQLDEPHIGLVDVLAAPPLEDKAAASFDPKRKPSDPPPRYPLLFEELAVRKPRGAQGRREGPSRVIDSSKIATNFFERFNAKYAGLLAALDGCTTDAKSGWFIAGGSVLGSLLTDQHASALFDRSDIDIFIYSRSHDDAEERATELARQIITALGELSFGRSQYLYREPSITRTLFTLNLDLVSLPPVQIILRVYQSPAEVLCGFDIDCCCFGFGADGKVWGLPRGLEALQTGVTLLNPLHAWPRQPSYELRLAKYAARGFPVAAPGLHLESSRLQWKVITRSRLIELRGAARLLHMDMALGLPENGGFSKDRGFSEGYRGCNVYTATHKAPRSWEAAIRKTFATSCARYEGGDDSSGYYGGGPPEIDINVLPTDFDLAKSIIEDPYGWIQDYYEYDRGRESASAPGLDKLVMVKVESADELASAWATILDAGEGSSRWLMIPRRLTWSVLPRSREYMNMDMPYEKLFRSYDRPLVDEAAALARVRGSEYGEPFLEAHREKFGAG